jgi:hypothetical protein
VVGVNPPASGSITKAQAVAYAHAVNLQAGDLPGFTSSGSETEAPRPGQLALEEIRCSNGVSPARRIAKMESTEFSAGSAFYSKIMKSTVEVWPTPTLVASNNSLSLTAINETRLLRTEAIRAHIYRDIFGFTTGPAEIELEAIGFGYPIPASTEARALQLLLDRARANTI